MMAHLMILAGCFPNCTPDPSSGFSSGPGGSSSTGLGAAAVILVGYLLWKMLTSSSKGGKK
jgi:hypothetical protein